MRGLLKILFSITLLELFLGGGGRIFEMGAATLRMVLFFMNILIVALLYFKRYQIPTYTAILIFVVTVFLIFYSILGLINGAQIALLAEDVKPLSYFYSILFFSYYIDSEQRVHLVVKLLKQSSLFMAMAYIIIQLLFYLNLIHFTWFYQYTYTQISASDFIFRGTSGLFFYKGFAYMVVGLIFWIHSSKSFGKSIAIVLLTVAMILTGTRGVILVFGMLYALFYGVPLLLRLNVKMLILSALLVFGSIYFFANRDIGNKELSDSIRVDQTVQVVQDIDFISFFIGHGFGIGVPIRPVHMEIGYLEVFHKQGILGLSLWGLLFFSLYKTYVQQHNLEHIRKAFFLGTLFLTLLSLTNPFFNNPIGISMFMLTLASFKALNKSNVHMNQQTKTTTTS